MKHPNPRRIAPFIILILLAVLAYLYFDNRNAAADNDALSASGTIEATEIRLAAEIGGRVREVLVVEGDPVHAGDMLARLDTALLEAQRAQAEAAVIMAQANAAAAEANADAAEASESAAQSVVDAAQASSNAAQASYDLLVAGPSDEQLAVAQTLIDKAQIAADAAQDTYDALSEAARETDSGKALKLQLDLALNTLENAQAQYDLLAAGARAEQLSAAQATAEAAAAQLAAAQANLAAAASRTQAAQAQADAANAQAQSAQAAVNLINVQIGKMTLTTPADGVVLTLAVQPGEMATPGATLLVIARLDSLTITVYVPEDRYGTILLGQSAQVAVDSYPGATFTATVVHIADKAEFTPRNVQTAEGRRTTVFAVKLTLENLDGKLKPGMPADVVFGK